MFEVSKWALLILLIVASLLWALRIWVSTWKMFLSRDKDKKDKEVEANKEQTLGYPKGIVRGFLAIAITFIVTVVVVFAEAGTFDAEVAKWATGAYGAVIAFYFGSKALDAKKS